MLQCMGHEVRSMHVTYSDVLQSGAVDRSEAQVLQMDLATMPTYPNNEKGRLKLVSTQKFFHISTESLQQTVPLITIRLGHGCHNMPLPGCKECTEVRK